MMEPLWNVEFIANNGLSFNNKPALWMNGTITVKAENCMDAGKIVLQMIQNFGFDEEALVSINKAPDKKEEE